jgi:DNA-binding beta-propeller fold protein YncE
MKGLDQCDQHQEVLKFFCEDENQLCCSTCAIVDHRKCHSVVEIQKVAGRSAYRSSTLKVKLEEVKEKANEIIDSIVSSKEKLDEDAKEIPVKIRRMRDEVMAMLDELEISVVKDVDSFKKETLEKLAMKQSQNEKYLADLTTCLETIDNVYQNGTMVQQFIVEQKMKNEVNVLHKTVGQECQGLETVTATFDFDETLKLPPLPVTNYVPGQLTLSFCLSEVANTIVPVNKEVILTPVISIDLKQGQGDVEEPLYTGIDFLPDGRLVAVDNHNKKCLVYNEKLEKVGSYQLSYRPKSVVVVSEDEVAITSSGQFKFDILHVTKSNDITLDRTIKVTTKYHSICQKDDKYFVGGTFDHSSPVRMISSTGEEKDFNINFPNKPYPKGTSACTYIRSSDKVVLTDRYEHTVYIYDVKTNTRIVVKDDEIKEPCGVAIGQSGSILVCSKETNSIVQISQTGQILSSHKMNMKYPREICVSRDDSFLVITNSYRGEKKLQKFNISY